MGTPFKVKKLRFDKRNNINSGIGRRIKGLSLSKNGRVIGYRNPNGKVSDIAVLPTIRHSAIRNGEIENITKECYKENIRVIENSATILFVVDSSGSMGVEYQMVKVKSLIYSLLIDAYQKRDRVGMISFRASVAKLLLPFTNSFYIAKKKLEKLETGGKTPLAHGLKLAFQLFKQEKQKNPSGYSIMVLVSDGRGNVPLDGKNSLDQSEVYGLYIKKLGVKTLVLDTETDHLAFGYSWELARLMNGQYMKLDNLNAENVNDIIFSL